jgi:hypothetical protein
MGRAAAHHLSPPAGRSPTESESNEQKFFGAFFKKRSCCLDLLSNTTLAVSFWHHFPRHMIKSQT